MNPVSLDPELAPGVINLLSERLKSLKEENERLKAENWNLRVVRGQISISDEGDCDAKACAQQSCPSANRVKVLEEEIQAQGDLRQHIDTLHEEISALRAKYKKEKTARKESQSICAEIEARLQGSLEEKCAAEQAREKIYQQLQVTTKEYEASKTEHPERQFQNLREFVSQLPTVDIPTHDAKLIHGPTFNASFIFRSIRAPNGILYYPGRTIPCPANRQSYIIVSSSFKCKVHKAGADIQWCRNHELSAIVGQTRELFVKSGEIIYYVGTYKCLGGPGILTQQRCQGLDEENVTALTRLTVSSSPTLSVNMVRDLYARDIALVDYLGLQCVGFNNKFYEALVAANSNSQKMHMRSDSKRKNGPSKEMDSNPGISNDERDSKKTRVA